MTRLQIFLAGLAVGLAVALPFGLVAQDVRALGPGGYEIAVGESAAFAWRVNTVNGTVSVCAAPNDPAGKTAPRCSPWGADILANPNR
jgi:hypothetical protein